MRAHCNPIMCIFCHYAKKAQVNTRTGNNTKSSTLNSSSNNKGCTSAKTPEQAYNSLCWTPLYFVEVSTIDCEFSIHTLVPYPRRFILFFLLYEFHHWPTAAGRCSLNPRLTIMQEMHRFHNHRVIREKVCQSRASLCCEWG